MHGGVPHLCHEARELTASAKLLGRVLYTQQHLLCTSRSKGLSSERRIDSKPKEARNERYIKTKASPCQVASAWHRFIVSNAVCFISYK